jgi:CRP/FNR family cyclic AMP-dependent transcriptional regulator
VIYDAEHPSTGIYLVIRGMVKVCRRVHERPSILMEIYSADEFFGESSVLNEQIPLETAAALEDTSLMFWTAVEIEQQVEKQPELGLAFIQMLTRRLVDCSARVESLNREKCRERIIRGLLRFAERLGDTADDGSVRIPPLSQQTISEYVGTSREIVTLHMNQLRQRGAMRYSRKGINIYPDALGRELKSEAVRHAGESVLTG